MSHYYKKIQETSSIKPPENIPYIIVLGAKVNGSEMSKVFRNRAETALAYWENNNSSIIVATGGKGRGEEITEASALKKYFMDNGVPEDQILEEDTSTSTYENLQYSKKLYSIEKAIIVSNDFHLYRATKIAKHLDIESYPLAAKTPNSVKVSLYLREFAAIGKMNITMKD